MADGSDPSVSGSEPGGGPWGVLVSVAARLRERVGVRFDIQLVPTGTLQRSEYKARRWRDERAYKR